MRRLRGSVLFLLYLALGLSQAVVQTDAASLIAIFTVLFCQWMVQSIIKFLPYTSSLLQKLEIIDFYYASISHYANEGGI